jgi:hypothetical protein
MIQVGLDEAGIRHVRVDGSMKTDQRHAALERFRKDPGVLVILLTISCGGVGLDLTLASRIHLVEPQWNPAAEKQAMARVYRMGQTKPVVAMRYIMRDSIEEVSAPPPGLHSLGLGREAVCPGNTLLLTAILVYYPLSGKEEPSCRATFPIRY